MTVATRNGNGKMHRDLAERALLHYVLEGVDNDPAHVFRDVRPEHFADWRRRLVFTKARDVFDEHDWVSTHAVISAFTPGELQQIGGDWKVRELAQDEDAELEFVQGRTVEDCIAALGTPPNHYPIISDDDAETLPPPEWGIDNIYPHGGLVVVFGQRGKGKTFLALGWAFAHASGRAWLGRTVRRGLAVHIMGEGRGGLSVRVRAQKEALGVSGPVGVYFIPSAVPMLDDGEVARLIATIKTLPAPPVVIVWDTLSRTLVGGDENSSKDMALYVAAVDRVKDAVGGTAVIVHHTGHNSTDRERGSSVLGGAADTIIALRDRDGILMLECDKMKDAPEFTPVPLRLQQVGESMVMSLHDERGVSAGTLTQTERQALRSLHDSFLDDGAAATAWLKASSLSDSSFYKARTSLVRKEFVTTRGNGRGARYTLTPHALALLSLHNSTVTP